jgi:glycosyltransferase involved in cell wall biosynthesis
MPMAEPLISIVIPLYNEAASIAALHDALTRAMAGAHYEIVMVDDGSIDGTAGHIATLGDPRLRLVMLERNYGQSTALAAGIATAEGECIVTMDGDLQNDPQDILPMVKQFRQEKLDLLVGWRKNRHDSLLMRTLPSRIANLSIRLLTGVRVHDCGCSLKVFRSPLAKKLDIRPGWHRFIPVLAHRQGARIGETVVRHHARSLGMSKYGPQRIFQFSRDLLYLTLHPRLAELSPEAERNYQIIVERSGA